MNLTLTLEKTFLNKLIEENQLVSIYLKNGINLKGKIASFDDNVILLDDDKENPGQIVYKDAISTIMPIRSK